VIPGDRIVRPGEDMREFARRIGTQKLVDYDVRIRLGAAETGSQITRALRQGIKIENVGHTIRFGEGGA
jgi:hypothetical protein